VLSDDRVCDANRHEVISQALAFSAVATAAEERPKSEPGEIYEECIGAKKHLVLGLPDHIG
jgi:hypothetical protein